ncbi:MAG: glycosyltransferase family 39 protein [Syntrophaceae bacterium]|nr:glycosyltransferase family 39 protein [Syntrophaceae bacterium]
MVITPREKRILSFVAALFAYRLLTIHTIQLAPDEAYYWYWGVHPSLSYADHPPMVAWIMALFTALGGDTELFVRLGGFLLSAAALFFLWDTARTLFPALRDLAGDVLLALNATLLFPAGSIVQTPDTPMLFFWAAAVWCGSRIAAGGSARWWYGWGAALGLGLLSKYTMILLVPCTFGFLVLCPSLRYWLIRKEPWIALALALLLFTPVLYWNWQHDWLSFTYQLRQGFTPKPKAAALKILEYVGGQAGVVTPVLFLAFTAYSVKAIRLCIEKECPAHLYLLCLSLPVILFFGISTSLGKVAEANWPAPAYISGFVLAGAVFRGFCASRPFHRRMLVAGLVLGLLAGLVVQTHLMSPFLPIPPEKDQSRQFHGWRDLGERISRIMVERPSERGYILVSDKGTTAAQAVFYSGDRLTGLDLFQPERYAFLGDLSSLRGRDAVLVLHGADEAGLKRYEGYFDALEPAGAHDAVFRGVRIERLSVRLYVARGFVGSWAPKGGGEKARR